MSDFSAKLFDFLKCAALGTAIGAPTAATAVFAYTKPDAVFLLLSKVQSVEIGDVKVALGQKAFELNADLQSSKNAIDQAALVRRAGGLGPREVERLVHHVPVRQAEIGDLDVSCDYEKADARMRLFVVIDKALEEKGLVELRERSDLLDRRRHGDFGRPRACYQAIVTAAGADVKSLIVSEMTRSFHNGFDTGVEPLAEKAGKRKEQAAKAGRGERVAAR